MYECFRGCVDFGLCCPPFASGGLLVLIFSGFILEMCYLVTVLRIGEGSKVYIIYLDKDHFIHAKTFQTSDEYVHWFRFFYLVNDWTIIYKACM